jgi:hypothetical protein
MRAAGFRIEDVGEGFKAFLQRRTYIEASKDRRVFKDFERLELRWTRRKRAT